MKKKLKGFKTQSPLFRIIPILLAMIVFGLSCVGREGNSWKDYPYPLTNWDEAYRFLLHYGHHQYGTLNLSHQDASTDIIEWNNNTLIVSGGEVTMIMTNHRKLKGEEVSVVINQIVAILEEYRIQQTPPSKRSHK